MKQEPESFTQIPNEILRGDKLSAPATAVLCYALSFSSNWRIGRSYLRGRFGFGKKSAVRAMSELVAHGYAVRFVATDANGEYTGQFYRFYRTPIAKEDIVLEARVSDEANGLLRNAEGAICGRSPKEPDKRHNTRKIPKENGVPETRTERLIRVGAEKMVEFLRIKHRFNGVGSMRSWKNNIQWMFLKDFEGTNEEKKATLRHVIETYTTVEHDEFAPQIYNAYDFRHKFVKLQKWVNKLRPPEESTIVRNVVSRKRFD